MVGSAFGGLVYQGADATAEVNIWITQRPVIALRCNEVLRMRCPLQSLLEHSGQHMCVLTSLACPVPACFWLLPTCTPELKIPVEQPVDK